MMPSGIEHMAPGGVSAANADDSYYNVMDERKTSCFVGSGNAVHYVLVLVVILVI